VAQRASATAALPLGCFVCLLAVRGFAVKLHALWQAVLAMAVTRLHVGCTFAPSG
jgi:hypothetical protein